MTTGVVGVVWSIFHLAIWTSGERPPRIDLELVTRLRSAVDETIPRGPSWLRSAARDVTSLGGPILLTMWVVLAAGFLLLRRQFRGVLFLLASTIGGVVVAYGLKGIVRRPRPPFMKYVFQPFESSFPSGHATMSAVVYLTIAALLVQLVRERSGQRFVIASALFITGLVGLSRVYLAAHYPSDVVAGWLIGSTWALGAAFVARSLQRTDHLDPPE